MLWFSKPEEKERCYAMQHAHDVPSVDIYNLNLIIEQIMPYNLLPAAIFNAIKMVADNELGTVRLSG